MKKICILSMQKVENFGSVLQAYGLKKTIESLGYDVCFIDIEKNEYENDIMKKYGKNISYGKEIGGKGISLEKINKYLFRRIYRKIIHYGDTQLAVFDTFRKTNLEINKSEIEYDCCVIGSDEVFSCQQGAPWGFTSQLFGNIRQSTKVITYAASCGPTRYEDLNDSIIQIIRKALCRIQSISVRDKNTHEFVKKILSDSNTSIVENIDPALMYDFSNELENIKLPSLPPKYCIIYAYKNRFSNSNEASQILSFCKKNGLTPVTIGGSQLWCKNHLVCTPFECLKAFQNSSFVITDTFHGAIFSIKYAKKFSIIIRDSNRNKLTDLINRVGVNEHLIHNIADINSIYLLNKNVEMIERFLQSEREKTRAYLLENLK